MDRQGGKATEKMATEVVDYNYKLSARGSKNSSAVFLHHRSIFDCCRQGRESKGRYIYGIRKETRPESPSTVQSAIRALYENETLSKEKNAYSITNRFFSLWINKQYSGAK